MLLNIRCAQNESSLNFSVNSVISFIAASTVFGGCRFNQQKDSNASTFAPCESLPERKTRSTADISSSPKKGAYHRHFSISRMKPISTSILFSEHALPLRIFRCGICNTQQGAREKGMLRAKGSRYGLKGPSDS